MREDGRAPDELRPFELEPDFIRSALGSVLVTAGRTRVICTASLQDRPPPWLDVGGWITAEYAMLPGSTQPRGERKAGGRAKEIQRLIGRSLRAAVDLERLVDPDGNGLSIVVDCDVIEADGGTRTASITGGFVALQRALARLAGEGQLASWPVIGQVAAVSVGLVGDPPVALLDLPYEEDARAVVDLNVVRRDGAYVEIQGTGEQGTFDRDQLSALLDLADAGIDTLQAAQRRAMLPPP
ncbi:MAG: ribonuclease PH [Deltaproteobacteria bacterium]|nr:MAG: ribonuclease PH [Deltaproteobacteria bacterium]